MPQPQAASTGVYACAVDLNGVLSNCVALPGSVLSKAAGYVKRDSAKLIYENTVTSNPFKILGRAEVARDSRRDTSEIIHENTVTSNPFDIVGRAEVADLKRDAADLIYENTVTVNPFEILGRAE